ncbi:MAG: hypothetical protein QOD68_1133, partial [Actinomycetota bacterium]|nr:hypothetical protein [Actinomycetota bacterium]
MRVRVLAAAVLVALLTALLVGLPLTVFALREDPSTGTVVAAGLVATVVAVALAVGVGYLQVRMFRGPLAGIHRRAEHLGSGQKREPLRP